MWEGDLPTKKHMREHKHAVLIKQRGQMNGPVKEWTVAVNQQFTEARRTANEQENMLHVGND